LEKARLRIIYTEKSKTKRKSNKNKGMLIDLCRCFQPEESVPICTENQDQDERNSNPKTAQAKFPSIAPKKEQHQMPNVLKKRVEKSSASVHP